MMGGAGGSIDGKYLDLGICAFFVSSASKFHFGHFGCGMKPWFDNVMNDIVSANAFAARWTFFFVFRRVYSSQNRPMLAYEIRWCLDGPLACLWDLRGACANVKNQDPPL